MFSELFLLLLFHLCLLCQSSRCATSFPLAAILLLRHPLRFTVKLIGIPTNLVSVTAILLILVPVIQMIVVNFVILLAIILLVLFLLTIFLSILILTSRSTRHLPTAPAISPGSTRTMVVFEMTAGILSSCCCLLIVRFNLGTQIRLIAFFVRFAGIRTVLRILVVWGQILLRSVWVLWSYRLGLLWLAGWGRNCCGSLLLIKPTLLLPRRFLTLIWPNRVISLPHL